MFFICLGSIYLFSLAFLIQSWSNAFLEMGEELNICIGLNEHMYKFSKGLRNFGFS